MVTYAHKTTGAYAVFCFGLWDWLDQEGEVWPDEKDRPREIPRREKYSSLSGKMEHYALSRE